MKSTSNELDAKVQAIFAEIAGVERAKWLHGDVPSRAVDQIAQAISSGYPPGVAGEIGFHIGDWQGDAAFLVALHLFPERFTSEEVAEGVQSLLLHAPAHLVDGARLAGYATEDFFGDGCALASECESIIDSIDHGEMKTVDGPNYFSQLRTGLGE
jgi:hypothetical protein